MTKDEELNIINSDCSSKTYEDIASEFNLKLEQVRYIFKKYKIKKEYYENLGYTALFLWETDILNDIENIENYIKTLCQGPS